MSAPVGNEYWKLRKTDGRCKNFTPDDIWQLWTDFVIWAKDNPKLIFQLSQKLGKAVQVPVERPLVLEEFYTWVDATHNRTIHHYFNEQDERYKEYLGVITRIKNHRYSDVAVGALVGQYNSNVSVRILGLADKVEAKQEIKQEVREAKPDLSKLSVEELKAFREISRKMRSDDGSADSH
ncbi:hypothetical protein ORI89_18740 [Sphingobacterium sp. UT-1RO-CII-1]|uniref:hypothetical protein n=1 Tax=Sphingobacterium sp. UT-1RO-CII-1 TaxID=2995225 RepID=UPI00227C6C35|nr:hypothetical protein [Sphingobacterium sp. UT-1RO-CII-1]MCY4781695.1 hypothetical protein [Sphingobacterium sp. UT-1RO-CII-1]